MRVCVYVCVFHYYFPNGVWYTVDTEHVFAEGMNKCTDYHIFSWEMKVSTIKPSRHGSFFRAFLSASLHKGLRVRPALNNRSGKRSRAHS